MVGQHIPPSDRNLRRGVQHTAVVDEKTLDEARQFDLKGLPLYDLKDSTNSDVKLLTAASPHLRIEGTPR